ncbi:hypothetical protein X474_27980 [Dethiosulfatarculus sandiegensis]|uniref:Uncharacterized protein n=1 Tax=Dethiosulfatarculus sandiegensis TaxID=1429043 RepID=A0A0D2G743_9BACT|nr:hypothetical protein X474_27980 [Dethiosulfatarculus sandiegensis]
MPSGVKVCENKKQQTNRVLSCLLRMFKARHIKPEEISGPAEAKNHQFFRPKTIITGWWESVAGA